MKKIWRLRKGADRRFRSGHPWVYSNELQGSPQGIEPGALVEICDAGGAFLARGFGNPHSLIAFRALSRDEKIECPDSQDPILNSLRRALKLREGVGLTSGSFRLCFGEVDSIPGLIIDFYRLSKAQNQVFVIQAHTAGANRILAEVIRSLEILVQGSPYFSDWARTSVVIRNDLSVRKLEGISEEAPRIEKIGEGLNPENLKTAQIVVQSASDSGQIYFDVDLIDGQKTGFFLDQFANIQTAVLRLKGLLDSPSKGPFRILDLCCYVGQWGGQIANAQKGKRIEVVAVDASAKALELAAKNIERLGGICHPKKADVFKVFEELENEAFDLVIVDPPALIKSRKDIQPGRRAYGQLFQKAFQKVRINGGIVCCSCSGLFEEEMMAETLAKAERRAGVSIQWVGRGSHSPDHPILPEFPEGRYLKSWFGFRSLA